MTTQLIGKRIKALREERGLSQENLAEIFGFNDRQTVSAIETGARRVSAEELVLAVERLDTPLEYFTDPFLLAGEGRFSWRQSGVNVQHLEAYERRAGRWIAMFRTLAPQVGRETPLMRRSLGLVRRSSFEEAMRAGSGSSPSSASARCRQCALRMSWKGSWESSFSWWTRTGGSPARHAVCRNWTRR